MLNTILDMIRLAEEDNNLELITLVSDLLDVFEMTFNAPRNWQDLREELAREYDENTWAYHNLQLGLFEDEE